MGYWGVITANYDWCEPNYAYTPYIAEFFNTLSSLPIIWLGLVYMRRSLRLPYGAHAALFFTASLAICIVGVGSAAFHGTLLREAQMLDEIPMLWASALFLLIALTLENKPSAAQTTRHAMSIVLYCAAATIVYFKSGFEAFLAAYALTITAVVIVSAARLYTSPPELRRAVLPWVLGALIFYVGGFVCLWLPEQVFCGNRLDTAGDSALIHLFVPLHSYFHLTSAAGPFCWLTFATLVRLHKLGLHPSVRWTEPSGSTRACHGLLLPLVVHRGDRCCMKHDA